MIIIDSVSRTYGDLGAYIANVSSGNHLNLASGDNRETVTNFLHPAGRHDPDVYFAHANCNAAQPDVSKGVTRGERTISGYHTQSPPLTDDTEPSTRVWLETGTCGCQDGAQHIQAVGPDVRQQPLWRRPRLPGAGALRRSTQPHLDQDFWSRTVCRRENVPTW
jgi:hypothetical protein